MFSLTLTEETGDSAGPLKSTEIFTHFCQNFRELPAGKLARIQAILAEPPAPQRKTRADAGKARAPKITTPPQPTLNIQ